jgi:hypothetical protein
MGILMTPNADYPYWHVAKLPKMALNQGKVIIIWFYTLAYKALAS